MALTRVITETVVVGRCGPMLAAAGMAVTVIGTNADLDDPLAWATRRLGHSTADANTVTDAELASVAVADYDDFLDLAEYRALLSIVTNLDDVDLTAGPRSEKFSQLAAQVQKRLDSLKKQLSSLLRPLKAGYLRLDFLEHNE